jgi:hypothetical protein
MAGVMYRGIAGKDQWFTVYRQSTQLSPRRSQRLRNHSPTGFAWGYGGSGPAQLALALLLDVTHNETLSLELYQQFKREIVCTWASDRNWEMDGEAIFRWVRSARMDRIIANGPREDGCLECGG